MKSFNVYGYLVNKILVYVFRMNKEILIIKLKFVILCMYSFFILRIINLEKN